MFSVRTIIEGVGILIAAIALWYVFRHPVSAPVGVPQMATQSPETAGVKKIDIAPKKLKVYAAQIKKKINLPKAEQDNAAIAVLDSSKIAGNYNPQTITTTLNTDTGETQTSVVVDPYPWFAAKNDKEARISYGLKNSGKFVGRMQFTDDFFQVKAISLGINTSIDTDGSYFLGVGASYRW